MNMPVCDSWVGLGEMLEEDAKGDCLAQLQPLTQEGRQAVAAAIRKVGVLSHEDTKQANQLSNDQIWRSPIVRGD